MNENFYQSILADMRAGVDVESMVDSCGCMGCPLTSWTDTEDKCQCKQGCGCRCTLPEVAERNKAGREQMQSMIQRARLEIAGEKNK